MTRTHRPLATTAALFASASLAFVAAAGAQTPPRDAGVARPQGGAPTTGFTDPQRINAGAEVQTGSGPARESGPTGQLRGSGAPTPDDVAGPIGPGDAARLIRARMAQLRPCYDRGRATQPDLAGRVELRWTIGADGRVTQAAAAGMPAAPAVATCLRDTLRTLTFPRPSAPTLAMVYPVTFAPDPVVAPARRPRGRPIAPPRRPTTAARPSTTPQR